mgnify:CR=1 FL=1
MKFDSSVIRFNFRDKEFRQNIYQIFSDSLPNYFYLCAPILLLTISIVFLNNNGATAEVIDGVGVADQWLIISNVIVFSSLNTGTSTLAAQAYGAQNFKLVGIYLHRALVLRIAILIPGILLLLWTENILSFIGVTPEVAFNAGIYCQNVIIGVVALSMSDTLKSYVIAHNIFLPLLYIQGSLILVQIFMCQFFVSWLGLGLAGAAYAFSATQLIGFALIVIYIWKWKATEHTLFWPESSSFNIGELFTQLKQETWIGLFMFIEWMGYLIVFLLAARLSVKELQAFVYMNNAVAIVYFLPAGVAVTLGTYIAGAMGDGNLVAVKKHARVGNASGLIITIFSCTLLFGIPEATMRIYTEDIEIIKIGATLLRTYGCYYILDCQQMLLNSMIKAIGKEVEGAIIFSISIFGVGITSAYLLCFVVGLESRGLLVGIAIGIGLMVAFSIYLLKKVDLEELSLRIRIRANADKDENTESNSPIHYELREIRKLKSATIHFHDDVYSRLK